MRVAPILVALALAAQPAVAKNEPRPYFMCVQSTQDGLLFSGGMFDESAARKFLLQHCGLSPRASVMLVETVAAMDGKRFIDYRSAKP